MDKNPAVADPARWLQKLSLGEAQELEPYTIYPLCVEDVEAADPGLLLTHQAIEAQILEILEKGEGEVQELEALNRGNQPVVVLEGDTLVGCKQNRVVARSVILGKGQKTPIPVGCMEQGRWAWKSGHFGSGSMRVTPSVRRASIREVRDSKKGRTQSARLDQRRLWQDVACCLEVQEVSSGTSDFHAVIEERGEESRRRSRTLKKQAGQVGVLVMASGLVSPETPAPKAAFLRRLTAQGFRGIGPQATLDLTPGPGLTLVVGRNGSGKSSFAEGLHLGSGPRPAPHPQGARRRGRGDSSRR
jgi:hypothetical protein